MSTKESEIENIILTRLQESLIDVGLKVVSQDKWKTSRLTRWFDIVIYKGKNPHVVFEIKSSLASKNTLARATDQVRSSLSITNARFGIVTDNSLFFIYDRNEKENDFIESDFDGIIERITKVKNVRISQRTKWQILSIIKESAGIHLSQNLEISKFLQEEKIINKIKFDSNRNSFYFDDRLQNIKSFENQFFNKIFGDFLETKICRYTTLDTLFSMLNFISFRMNGLVGMNDKSEVNYVDNYLNGVERPLSKMHHNTVIALNKRYITSCSRISRKDELTLWRLYGDDGTGVCLIFDIKKENLNDKVLIQRVKYADHNGNHPELDFLKHIREGVEILTGFTFEFRNIGLWKHFFKPYDYAIEEEVRLLVIEDPSLNPLNSNWVKTYSHSIINPFIDFQLNNSAFPIQLSEVILGPKSPEQDSNIVQLQEMVRRKRRHITAKKLDSNLKRLKIKISKINHYR
ncbi:type I restriction enzyme HsdR N-terminal domain-containing protein [Aureisphaera galaxeae]|uniref:DUF2971 domain-containing protein n=1 Tax=Aureisphaera galaxeae TaxID=1538023 RepID=UPI0023503C8C|nr:DUF2971 domain-containing protein [Aureisphaera galaxeae]MDC8003854.1 type I restriction enzyme HsdR N-terminal domain-containing protein [Aureisphaera galaxeae]